MKILLLTQVFPPRKGGSGQWLWELYRRLRDFDVHVVAGTTPGDDAFDRSAGLSIERLPLDFRNWGIWHVRGGREYLKAFTRLRRIVTRFRPDVIHCGKCLPEGLIAASLERWWRIPYFVYVHGEELTLAMTSGELRRLTKKVLDRARRIVANSEHTKRILAETWAVAGSRVMVMHPGVDTTRFVPAPLDSEVRRRLGWSDRRVILTVGALQKRKGQDMLIRALPEIRSRCPDVLYAIVGEGWERPYLDELVSANGVGDLVQFRAIDSDAALIECYQQCDVFALPNRQVGWDFEGFGIVLLEAQACGKPVVAGRSGGTIEALSPGRTGELVACDEPSALAQVLTALLEDPDRRQRAGKMAREWVEDHFAWDALGKQAISAFQDADNSARASA